MAHATGWQLLWATYWFAFQIYCDFSGYTDIAIGCARLFALHMTRNFAYPYFSTNIKDFWRRWHISLSTWFRAYLYIPLGGNRLGARRTALNAFIVFVVSGFWHGANWTFVIWGILHGLYFLIYTQWIEKPHARDGGGRNIADLLGRLGATLVTFHLVCLAWVFFRADSASTAFAILGKIARAPLEGSFERPGLTPLLWIGVLVAVEWLQRSQEHGLALGQLPAAGALGDLLCHRVCHLRFLLPGLRSVHLLPVLSRTASRYTRTRQELPAVRWSAAPCGLPVGRIRKPRQRRCGPGIRL